MTCPRASREDRKAPTVAPVNVRGEGMKRFDDIDMGWENADPKHFTGKARVKRSAAIEEDGPVKVYRVEFQPGAFTHWHAHSGVQLLLISEGRCQVQKWGEEIQEVKAGGGVFILPNEKHWHGAPPASKMTHLAININASTAWMEPVEQ